MRYEGENDFNHFGGVREKDGNTLGGKFAENRGRRNAGPEAEAFETSPFEDGKLYNWDQREGWDDIYASDRMIPRKSYRGLGPKGYKRDDKLIYEDVCETLTLARDIDASQIDVSVNDGVIYLSGEVKNRQLKKRAESYVEGISGVHDVQNLLSFSHSQTDYH